jgi:uncharacterized protein (DUF433 family)
MTSESQVADYLSSISVPGAQRKLTVEDIRACCLFAADLARRSFLSPPAVSRFMRDEGLNADAVREVAIWAADILEHFGGERGDEALMAELPGADDEMIHRAFAYAASLTSEEILLGSLEHSLVAHELWGQLSSTDLRRIAELCVFHRSLGLTLFVPTPEDWLQRWSGLVEHIEAGYNWALDEIINDLTARDLLEDVVLLVAPPARALVRESVDAWDLRYDAATTSSRVSLMGSQAPWEPLRWWWFRIPTRGGAMLEDDLRARGIHAAGS